MNLGFIATSTLALPTIQQLLKGKQIRALGIPDQNTIDTEQIILLAKQNGMEVIRFKKEALEEQISQWISTNQLDTVLVFTFPWKIPEACLSMPKNGFYNAHCAPLPKYRGAAPVFWLIRNRERQGGLYIHEMTKSFDEGAIVLHASLPLSPEETLGTHRGKISIAATQWVQDFLLKIEKDELHPQPQDSQKAKYWPKPQAKDMTINWETQTATEVKAIVKASNPNYGGAITFYQNLPLRILEVTTADSRSIQQKFPPGTILNTNTENNLFVACKGGGLLRIEVIKLEEGYFSGWKLFTMGVRPGTKFSSPG